jgi:hypothetical protein
MIEKRHSVVEIGERLAARYETTPEQALADVEKLIAKLLDEKLIAETEAPAPAVAEPAPERRLPYRTPELNMYTDMSDLLALDPPMPGLPEIPIVERK